MYLVHIASELAPVAKVGGLADVVYGLCQELVSNGVKAEIIIPKYDCIDLKGVSHLSVYQRDLKCYYHGEYVLNTVWQGNVDGLSVFFIEPHNKKPFFSRGTFYECEDNVDRFTYFSRVALEFLLQSGKNPDVIHCHDWHTALIPVLYHEIYKSLNLKVNGFIFTIHNLEHQGLCFPFVLDYIGLNGTYLLNHHKLQDPHRHDHINLLKGAIVYSTYFTTVSPNYAKEIQTPLGGCGLHHVISHYHTKFSGILNGLDYSYWDPHTDCYLPVHYSPNQKLIEGKKANKEHLKKRLYLDPKEAPIVSCIARLVLQKGVHLIEHALFRTLEKGGQFILLGTSPDSAISHHFHALKINLGHNHNVHFEMQYNEGLSHQIYSGSDFFIVPSLFEPCGLTQLIALRYGTIPVVRKTGGLADTVFDIDHSQVPLQKRNGYTFDHADTQGVDSALDRCLATWFSNPEKLLKMMQCGMLLDYSWKKPCEEYMHLYKRCLK